MTTKVVSEGIRSFPAYWRALQCKNYKSLPFPGGGYPGSLIAYIRVPEKSLPYRSYRISLSRRDYLIDVHTLAESQKGFFGMGPLEKKLNLQRAGFAHRQLRDEYQDAMQDLPPRHLPQLSKFRPVKGLIASLRRTANTLKRLGSRFGE